MRKILLSLLLALAAAVGLAAAPSASAKPDLPEGCDLLANTHCHCISPWSGTSCIILE